MKRLLSLAAALWLGAAFCAAAKDHGVVDKPADLAAMALGDVFRECSHCPQMVVLAGGVFEMIEVRVDPRYAAWKVIRRPIKLSRFAMGRTEVTAWEFTDYLKETGLKPVGCGPKTPLYDLHFPFTCVSFREAQGYVDWLNKKVGAKLYRLPSEAEFQYALRAGSKTAHPWGEDFRGACKYDNFGPVIVKPQPPVLAKASPKAGRPAIATERRAPRPETIACDDGVELLAPVRTFAPNPFGLHGLAGNAAEWLADCHSPDLNALPATGAPFAPRGDCARRAVGGASYRWSVAFMSGHRRALDADLRRPTLGFRLVRVARPGK